MTIRTTLNKERFVDNTYGTNAIGWPAGNHSFSQLVGSDRLQLALYNSTGVKTLEFAMDYISASPGAPGGYKTLGVSGGDGRMLLGASSNVWAVDTSLSVNFRDPIMVPVLTVNSPPTDANYTPPAAPYTNWIFDVYYDVTFRTEIFGPDGFGYPRMSYVHASPSKTGSNSEICLYANERPLAVADSYVTTKNQVLVVPAPGILANDFGGNGGPLTAVLFAGPTRGTLVGGLKPDGSFIYSPKKDFRGDDKFTYQASNSNGLSTVTTVAIKVTK
jgi:hypothetical protein